MNQRPQGLNVQKAITGFLHCEGAEGLASVTVSGYEREIKTLGGICAGADHRE